MDNVSTSQLFKNALLKINLYHTSLEFLFKNITTPLQLNIAKKLETAGFKMEYLDNCEGDVNFRFFVGLQYKYLSIFGDKETITTIILNEIKNHVKYDIDILFDKVVANNIINDEYTYDYTFNNIKTGNKLAVCSNRKMILYTKELRDFFNDERNNIFSIMYYHLNEKIEINDKTSDEKHFYIGTKESKYDEYYNYDEYYTVYKWLYTLKWNKKNELIFNITVYSNIDLKKELILKYLTRTNYLAKRLSHGEIQFIYPYKVYWLMSLPSACENVPNSLFFQQIKQFWHQKNEKQALILINIDYLKHFGDKLNEIKCENYNIYDTYYDYIKAIIMYKEDVNELKNFSN